MHEIINHYLSVFNVYQALVLSVIVFATGFEHKTRRILALFLLIYGLCHLLQVIFINIESHNSVFVHLLMLYHPVFSLVPVLFYFYLIKSAGVRTKKSSLLLHLIIPFVLLIISLLFYLPLSFNEKLMAIKSVFVLNYESDSKNLLFTALDTLIAVQVFVYIWLIIKLIKDHNIKIQDFYSYSEGITYNWLKFVLSVYFLFFVLFFLVGNTFDFYKENNILTVYYLTQLIIVLLIVSFGLRQKQAGVEDIEQHNCEATATTMRFEAKEELFTQLQDIIKKDKIFLDSNLKIDQLAFRLNTNRTYLSAIIKEMSGLNFCNYVNAYRVEEFLELTEDVKNTGRFNIEGLARSVGFKSKSSFYCAFRKEKKCTPLEYLKRKNNN